MGTHNMFFMDKFKKKVNNFSLKKELYLGLLYKEVINVPETWTDLNSFCHFSD